MSSVQQLLDLIQKNVGVPWQSQRGDGFSDGILVGAPDTHVTGIVTAFTPTIEILKKAAASGKNTIICRESPWWSRGEKQPVGWRNGPAPPKELLEKDVVYQAKKDILEKNKMVVIRLTENWDARTSDAQLRGLAGAIGWAKFHSAPKVGTEEYDPRNVYFQLPSTTLGKLTQELKGKLKLQGMRVIGNPAASVSKVALTHGLLLVADAERILKPGVDVVIAGDTVEWEGGPYFADLVTAGMSKGLILLGELGSEDPGSGEMATWLKTFVTDVPVEWYPAGEPFWTLPEEHA